MSAPTPAQRPPSSGAAPLDEAELARRRPLWTALSDLWLDTELQADNRGVIARRMLDSGYDRATLERIMAEEVAPAVYCNLYSVAGEWAGFDEDWLCAEILSGLHGRGAIGRWWLRRRRGFMTRLVRDDWHDVLRRFDELAARGARKGIDDSA